LGFASTISLTAAAFRVHYDVKGGVELSLVDDGRRDRVAIGDVERLRCVDLKMLKREPDLFVSAG